jgi:hypothetical protein
MELDFDKEIDALLRKARSGTEAAAAAPGSAHFDADEIAAFAENALPEKARGTYITHFAGCDRCRKILSQAILLNAEAEQQAASLPVTPEPVETRAAWRKWLFGLPTVAYTMGTLVLLFSGFLGYMVWQNAGGEQNAEVSQVSEKETYNASSSSNRSVSNAANMAANAMSNVSNSAITNSAARNLTPLPAANTTANTGPGDIFGKAQSAPVLREEDKLLPAPTVQAEQPAAAGSKPKELIKDDNKAADEITESRADATTDAEKQKTMNDLKAMKKEAPRSATLSARKVENLPLNGRDAGGAKMDSDTRYAAARRIGGRSFEKKDGVWYDSEYNGQPTINVRRGTDDYNKLDAGLRSIANGLTGTVVVIWKSKSYRIQ